MFRLEATVPPDSNLEQVADQEIREFEEYFMKELSNERLTKSEKAILKTWFIVKIRTQDGKKEG